MISFRFMDERLIEQVSLRLTTAEKQALKERVAAAGMSQNNYLRRELDLKPARQKPKEVMKPPTTGDPFTHSPAASTPPEQTWPNQHDPADEPDAGMTKKEALVKIRQQAENRGLPETVIDRKAESLMKGNS